MQGLKVMVVGMGALIVISLGLLAWGFYSRLAPPTDNSKAAPVAGTGQGQAPGAQGASVALPEFGEVHIELPAGCTLAGMYSDSGRLYVRTGPEGLCERILVLDPVSGMLLGTFVFRP